MLVLSRKESEKLMIGDNIVITIVRIGCDNVRIGIEAPAHVAVLRGELQKRPTIPTEKVQPCEPS